jgi:hypothetical protein
LRRLILALSGLCVCVLCAGALNSNAAQTKGTWLREQITGYEKLTRHWQHVMGVAVTPETATHASVQALLHWRRLAKAARVRAQHPPHMAALLCIHHYEGSWTDTGAPFWGGLQMNYGFQATYGPWLLRHKGTADHWTPLEQIWVAEKAVVSRGFWPWPNTGRMCGVL